MSLLLIYLVLQMRKLRSGPRLELLDHITTVLVHSRSTRLKGHGIIRYK